MWLFMGVAAVNSQANLLFAVVGLMAGILLVSGSISRLVLRRLSVVRSLPDNGVVGETLPINYTITNEKRFWPSFSVTLSELDGVEAFTRQPHAYMLHCAARQSTVVPAEMIPKRRGLHTLNRFQVSTSFPFGFITRATLFSRRDTLLIYPAIGHVEPRLLQRLKSAEQSGLAARPRRDGADDFYGVKEFRSGENPRMIYWRRSARTGTLVTREMTHMSPPRLLVMLDTYLPHDAPHQAAADLEKLIAMAASLADRALETGLSVGIVAWAGGWAMISPNRGKRHRRDLLTLLATLPVNYDHDQMELLSVPVHRDSGHTRTTAILMTRDAPSHHQSLTDTAPMVISSSDSHMVSSFRFSPTVDFANTMPQPGAPVPALAGVGTVPTAGNGAASTTAAAMAAN
jgi:uncharacterized protein (DUF58 family)